MLGVGWLGHRISIWRHVVWRPTLAVVGSIYGVVVAFAFVRDDVLPAILSAQDANTWHGRLAPQLHFRWYWWVIGILAALLIVALEGAYRHIRQEGRDAAAERATLTAEIKKLETEKPATNLRGEILQTVVGHLPDRPNVTMVWINVSVLNRGAPSIVDMRVVSVTIAGVQKQTRLIAIPKNSTLHMTDGTAIVLNPGDAIYEKGTARVETGAQITGWMLVEVDGALTNEEFFAAGNRVDVTFQDYLATEYVATHVFRADRGGMRYYPGSGGKFRPK